MGISRSLCDDGCLNCFCILLALAYQGKDIIVFRFIIEYSSLRDFGPFVIIIGLFFIWGFFERWYYGYYVDILAIMLKLEISYNKVIIFLMDFDFFWEERNFGEDYIFLHREIFESP